MNVFQYVFLEFLFFLMLRREKRERFGEPPEVIFTDARFKKRRPRMVERRPKDVETMDGD